jgi:hypothetical protein
MTTLFNYDPYYDDFDEDKNFMRVLFRPGYSVQARELTQLQTILSNQIERFGNHIFKSGSPITGGKISIDRKANYVVLQTQYSGIDIDPNEFLDKTIVSFGNSKLVRAKVIAIDTTTINPILIIKYLSGDRFAEGESLRVFGQNIFATLNTTNAVGGSIVASVQDGIYYFKGQFVKIVPQFLVLETFYRIGENTSTINIKPSYKIGIEFDENILDEIDDTSLLDPAQGAFNYQAPGANRFQIATSLAKRTLDSADTSTFFEIIRLVDDVKTKEIEYPIYSEIEKMLARRTYDESGNYTIDPFVISLEEGDSANGKFNVVLDPGKAYVGGYEFLTIAPTTIEIPRARETTTVTDYDISTNYESSLVIQDVHGTMDITSYPVLDMHCVPSQNISTASAAAYNSTKIGTLNASMMRYNDSVDSNLGTTHSFKVNVFNANTSPITGTIPSSGSTTQRIILPTTISSNVANAYANMYFQITDGLGATLAPTLIVSSNATTINLASALSFVPASNTIRIQSDVRTTKSIVANTGSFISFSGNINSDSIDPTTGFTYISEPKRTSRIFDVPYPAIKAGTITNMDFFAKKLYANRTSDASTNKFTVTAEGTDTFTFSTTPGTIPDELILNNIICFIRSDSVTNAEFGITPNTVVSLANNLYSVVSLSSTSFEIDIRVPGVKADFLITSKINNAENSSTGTIRGKQHIPLVSGANLHAKVPFEMGGADTLEDANTVTNTAFAGGIVFEDVGATNFTDTATLQQLRTPGNVVSLQVPDVIEIVRITDSLNTAANVTTTMLSLPEHDVTRNYEFDNGQRKTHYDHATIKLKRGFSAPRGRIFVQYRYLKHLSAPSPQNDGMFTVDSYLKDGSNFTYDDIFAFNNAEDGKLTSMRSAFDFRPTRAIAGTSLSGAINPEPLQTIETGFEYYLSRIDQIVVKQSREFSVVTGKASLSPVPTNVSPDDMLIYTVRIPAYTDNVKDIRADFKNHRRYTMRDIGKFDDRIRNLEYYVTLSALEKTTASLKILDNNGLERSKYGILVDNFTTKEVQASREEVDNDNSNLIDNGELQPASLMRTVKLIANTAQTSATAKFNGIGDKKILSLPYTSTELAKQPYATKSISIANALFAAFRGTTRLWPEFVADVDTGTTAKVTLNSTQGIENAFSFVNSAFKYLSDKNPQFANDKDSPFAQVATTQWYQQSPAVIISNTVSDVPVGGTGGLLWQRVQTVTDMSIGTRTVTLSQDQITTSSSQVDVGTFITDLAIQPYMKPQQVLFSSEALRPSATYYSFFDDVDVNKYVVVPNRVQMNANTTLIAGETIFIANTVAELAANLASFISGGSSYSEAYVAVNEANSANVSIVNETGKTLANKYVYGLDSGTIMRISSVIEHRSGITRNVTSTLITLAEDAPDVNISGNTLYLVRSSSNLSGIGAEFLITNYDTTTKVATVSGASSYVGGTYSYSFGNNRSNAQGQVGGAFFIPVATFRSGQRNFRITESFNNTYDADAISYSDKVFTSSGMIANKTTLVDTVLNVDVGSTIVGTRVSSEIITSTRSTVITQFRVDPLAQTFFVDEQVYPNGLFLESVDLFFRNKDENLPVWVQIRPTVNGLPSSDYWYPESVTTLYPRQVNVSENPTVSSAATSTRFTFSSPVFLKPGLHALVVLTESPDYILWTAEKGGTTRNNEFIGTNPYIGTLYKSQNAMEYVPYLNEDMMFILNRCSFITNQVVSFVLDNESTQTINADKFRLLQNSISPLTDEITTANYKMITKFVDGTKETTYRNIVPQQVYSFGSDESAIIGNRRRVVGDRGDVKISLDMSTTSNHISPIVSLESLYINVWENFIDNAAISASGFTIIDGGSGYTNANSIIITSSTGIDAVANVSVDSNGNVIGIYVTSGGSGYLDDFTISYPRVGDAGTTVTANANIVLNSEFDSSSGPCDAKYITKPVILADGFDAGDLRVFLAGNKQGNSEISVFYKVLNSSDPTAFKDRPYQKMVCMNPSPAASKTAFDYTEYEYRPFATDNQILYTSASGVTYDNFKTFAIKIVMTSSDPTIVPKVKDLRIIALPAE